MGKVKLEKKVPDYHGAPETALISDGALKISI